MSKYMPISCCPFWWGHSLTLPSMALDGKNWISFYGVLTTRDALRVPRGAGTRSWSGRTEFVLCQVVLSCITVNCPKTSSVALFNTLKKTGTKKVTSLSNAKNDNKSPGNGRIAIGLRKTESMRRKATSAARAPPSLMKFVTTLVRS